MSLSLLFGRSVWIVVLGSMPWLLLAQGVQQTAYSKAGMVVSCDHLASAAGVAAMAAGGNAVDGATATAFALAVTCPRAGNLGGGGFAVIRTPDGKVITNDYREKAPGAAHRDMFLDEQGKPSSKLSLKSALAIGVPGTVAGLLDIHERYGRLSRTKVMARAIHLARRGFHISYDLASQLQLRQEQFKRHPATAAVFTKEGQPWQAGDLLRQPDLAKTLMRIRQHGHLGFYQGLTADLLVAEMKRSGGLITHADLEAYSSVWRQPIRSNYRGYEIYSMPPPSSGGILLAQMLNMLENIPVADLGFGSAKLLHYMIEAQRRAYANRNLADPDFYDIAVAKLTGKDFAKTLFDSIDPNQASRSADIHQGPNPVRKESPQTTHISVSDKEGYMVSMTTTLNGSYGSMIMVPGAGFLLNNEMDDFAAAPGVSNLYGLVGREVNKVEPHKRMLSSMTPTIVTKDGKPWLVVGSPGGSTIINAVLQVILNTIDHKMPLDQAVRAARIHHQWLPERVLIEPWGMSVDTLNQLKKLGHDNFVTRPHDAYNRGIGVVNSIIVMDDVMQGVADPRRGGNATGW